MRSDIASEAADAAFEELGVAAIWQPPSGPPVDCTVMLTRPDVRTGFGDQIVTASHTIDVRATDVPAPAEGGSFTLGEDEYLVIGTPERRDRTRLVWTMPVTPQ